MSSTVRPIIRPEVGHLLDAEHQARQARRLIRPDGPGDDDARFDAVIRIDHAIASLVAARLILDPPTLCPTPCPTL